MNSLLCFHFEATSSHLAMKTPMIVVIFCCAHWFQALVGQPVKGGIEHAHSEVVARPNEFLAMLHSLWQFWSKHLRLLSKVTVLGPKI